MKGRDLLLLLYLHQNKRFCAVVMLSLFTDFCVFISHFRDCVFVVVVSSTFEHFRTPLKSYNPRICKGYFDQAKHEITDSLMPND